MRAENFQPILSLQRENCLVASSVLVLKPESEAHGRSETQFVWEVHPSQAVGFVVDVWKEGGSRRERGRGSDELRK